MATITTYTTPIERPRSVLQVLSDPAGPMDDFELTGLPAYLPHAFASAQFFDAMGDPVIPTAGTIDITIQTALNDPNYEFGEEHVIDATNPTTISWAANTRSVKAVPTGLTGVTTWKLVLMFNQT